MPYKVEAGGKLYPFDRTGNVPWLDFSWTGLGQSMDATILYVKGIEHMGMPPLGAGLEITGDERSWPHKAAISPYDIPVFLDRYKAFDMLSSGIVRADDGELRLLTEEEQAWCNDVLGVPELDQEAIQNSLASQYGSLGSMVSRLAYLSQLQAARLM